MPDLKLHPQSYYQKGNFPFPSDDISPKEKQNDPEWTRKWLEGIYSKWLNDQTAIPYSKRDEFENLRAYAEGRQGILKYQKTLLEESENGTEMEGWMNINWDIMPIMAKFLRIVAGMYEDVDHKCVATAIDPKSIDFKEKDKVTKWFRGRYKPLFDAINKVTEQISEPEWIPENVTELNLYEQAGGLKLAKETEIEEALAYTFYISDWKEIKRRIIYDFCTISRAAVKDYTDKYTQKAKARYVDPKNLIMQYSRHWDHRNSEFGGEVLPETISNIRKVTGLPESTLKDIAQFYNGRNGNATIETWANFPDEYDSTNCPYDNFQVLTVDGEWFSIDKEYRTKRTNDRGVTMEYEEKYGKVYDNDKKQTSIKEYKTVYRGKLIVGTEIVYDYGLQYDVPRPGKKEVELSYKLYVLDGRSIVDSSIINVDQIQLAMYRLQNAIAMAANPGIAVEYTSLMNMKLGGNSMEPLDILSIRRGTGDLLWKATTHKGIPNVPNMRPIQELQGGIGPFLDECIKIFEVNLNFIRETTGINKIADATDPNPEQSVGGSQLAIAATNNALKHIYSGYINLKEKIARSSSLRIQISLEHNNKMYNGYIPVLGGVGTKILSIGGDAIDVDYDIRIVAKPTRERKQAILAAATEAMKRDKDGYSDIEFKDFLMIERLLEDGNEKLAEMILNYTSERNKKLKLQIQRENMQIDADNQQKIATTKSEMLREEEKVKHDNELEKQQQKYDLEDRNNENEHNRKLKEIDRENEYKEQEQSKQLKSA